LIPLFSITPRQRSISELTLSRNCAGESDSVVTPWVRSLSRVPGAYSAC